MAKQDIESHFVKKVHMATLGGAATWLGAVLGLNGSNIFGLASFILGGSITILTLKSLNEAFADPIYR